MFPLRSALFLLVLHFALAASKPHLARRPTGWLLMKRADTFSNKDAQKSNPSNAQSQATRVDKAATPNPGSPATAPPSATTNTFVPQPDQNLTVNCKSAQGVPATFRNRECWYAAKVIAETAVPAMQCGNCVIGLFDAAQKMPFKPPGSVPPAVIQQQVAQLLASCNSPKPAAPAAPVSKRDVAPPPGAQHQAAPPSSNGTNVQILIGYNQTPNITGCPGI